MAGSGIHVHVDDREVRRVLRALERATGNLRPAFLEIGEALLQSHEERWSQEQSPEGEPWAPLSPRYQVRKKKHRDEILLLDETLRDTLRYQAGRDSLAFGTDRIYGATHQFGAPERGIPARPFLGLSGADKAIGDILRDHLARAARR